MRHLATWSLIALLASACGVSRTEPQPTAQETVIALVGGRVQAAPEAMPISDGVVVLRNDVITAVGRRADVRVPPEATVIDCAGGTVTAGFWNSHVHFTQPTWSGAATAPAERLTTALRGMLTSYGVVRALDTGSEQANTEALRRRIASGEVLGPTIMMAAGSIAPVGGSPYYILPARLPEAESAAAVVAIVETALDRGAEGIKLFTGSWATPRSIVVMPVEMVRAATDAAHRRGRFVIAHPSNSEGARAAIEGGVDILAHTFPASPDRQPWDRALPGMMRERGMALIPTLKLWPYELAKAGAPAEVTRLVLGNGEAQLKAFIDLGGQVLFGTDVGYMTEYDPTDEYVYMQQAGLSYAQILAALTTAPAARFGGASRTGRLTPGFAADVVVLDGDPAEDIRALARVRATLRAGRIIYRRP
ncbi:MAG TPA: amidohydrolase family protein [Candidatus Dormibacteraeota bacterium]|nr:amidohydrolase family protein [Candidatus Dormibacteraeota bacterium]